MEKLFKSKSNIQLLIAVLVVIGIVMIGQKFLWQKKLNIFESKGVETLATITNIRKIERIKRSDSYYIDVTFNIEADSTKVNNSETDNESSYSGFDEHGNYQMDTDKLIEQINSIGYARISVNSKVAKNFRVNDKVWILYLPDDTKNAILKKSIKAD